MSTKDPAQKYGSPQAEPAGHTQVEIQGLSPEQLQEMQSAAGELKAAGVETDTTHYRFSKLHDANESMIEPSHSDSHAVDRYAAAPEQSQPQQEQQQQQEPDR